MLHALCIMFYLSLIYLQSIRELAILSCYFGVSVHGFLCMGLHKIALSLRNLIFSDVTSGVHSFQPQRLLPFKHYYCENYEISKIELKSQFFFQRWEILGEKALGYNEADTKVTVVGKNVPLMWCHRRLNSSRPCMKRAVIFFLLFHQGRIEPPKAAHSTSVWLSRGRNAGGY